MSYYDIPWALKDGFIKPIMVNAAEGLGVPALGIIVFVLLHETPRFIASECEADVFCPI